MAFPPSNVSALVMLASAGCLLAGCATTHEVTVDAIRDSAAVQGTSYRLESVYSGPEGDSSLLPQVLTHVREALASTGAYEAPAGTAPEQVIYVETGVGPGHRKIVYEATVEPIYRVSRKDRKQIIAHEKFIRLSAREPSPASTGARGRELWSVHVVVDDERRELAPYLTVLAAALRDHIADQAPEERTILIKESEARRVLGQNQPPVPR